MDRFESLRAVKKAIGGEFYADRVDVLVQNSNQQYLYSDVYVRVSYNIAYMQMDVDIVWENDTNQCDYFTLGLHGKYNSNFQEFSCSNDTLTWKDGKNTIYILFDKK